ncbi:MAG: hydrolase TatD, partial [Planctomycetes bacterium]|nr:hydrolase TatD [Planctomycetota bacterium]
QSGQIDVESLYQTPQIDQRTFFSDNSVLRGQQPRVDAPIPN